MKNLVNHRSIILPLVILVFVCQACDQSNPTPGSWSLTPTDQAIAASATAYAATLNAVTLPLPNYFLTPSIIPPTSTYLVSTLTTTGPWLVYPTNGGQALVALNLDGTVANRVTIPPLLDVADLLSGLSPKGGVIAFRTGLLSTPEEDALYLLYLPEGKLQVLTPLFSEVEQLLIESQDQRALDAVRSVIQPDSLSWSPDGRYLAFFAALDRNSSDLYLYDTQEQKINRMTFGLNMVSTSFWSPDGQWVFTQEVMAINDNNGWTLGSVLRINVQTGETVTVYTPPPESTREVFVGWANLTTLISYSLGPDGGESLRLFELTLSKESHLFSGPFRELAFDPKTKTIAFIPGQSSSGTGSLVPGLYFLLPDNIEPQLVQTGNWQNLSWSVNGNEFLSSGNQGAAGVTPDGKTHLVPGEAHMSPSPTGKWLACWGGATSGYKTGIRLYRSEGGVFQEVVNSPVQELVWQPDSNGIFFISGNHLDMATFPSLQVVTLDSDVKPGLLPYLIWVFAHG
jgi:WD40 repeat protein